MEYPVISVIVPVYNVEEYLSICLNSILNQTFTNYELLLINDGSSDNSGAICNEFAKKDQRIKVVHQENVGVSSARNKGISIADGEYLCFIDADDWIEINYLSTMIEDTIKFNTDFLFSGYVIHDCFRKTKKKIHPNKSEGIGKFVFSNIINSLTSIPLWTCLIKKSVILKNKILFNELCKYGEDQEFILKALLNSNWAKSNHLCLYNYRLNESSAMVKKTIDHIDYPLAMIRVKNYLIKIGSDNTIVYQFTNKKITESINYVINTLTNFYYSPHQILFELKKKELTEYLDQLPYKWELIALWKIHPLIYLNLFKYLKRIKKQSCQSIGILSKITIKLIQYIYLTFHIKRIRFK